MSNTKITSNVIESGAVTTTHIASGAISASHLTGVTTANITENTNLYYTDTRARASISVTGGNLSYDNLTGVLQLTDSEIRDAISATSSGDGSLIYTAGTGVIAYTGPSASEVRAHLSAGTGVTYSGGQISIGQAVGTSDTVSFGNITTAGYLRGPANFTIDPAAYGDDTGTLIIAGNLQVDGTTTTINSTTLTVDDLNLTLASGAANAAAANGAGITVDGASATLLYQASGDKFVFNKALDVGPITSTGVIAAGTVATMFTSSDRAYLVAGTSDSSNQHLYLGSYHGSTLKQLTFSGSNNALYPQTTASIDLGLSSHKFKDAHLSGTVNALAGSFSDNVSIGSVGVLGLTDSDLAVYSNTSGHSGLRFGAGFISPTSNTGTSTSAAVDLGETGIRFKDLYLSGNVNSAGTVDVANDLLANNAKLKAIAESNTQTAIDVFVYDTRKDSDGGAWRKRTQHTSWYSEASDTRRGTRKDFPAVAVIVAHAGGVTIYDGDDPDMPMWMYIYAGYSHNYSIGFSQNGAPTAVTARDGVIYTTTNGGAQDNSVNGLFAHNFISDRMYQWNVSGGFGYYPLPIEGRDSGGSLAYHETKVGYDATKKLVSAYLNDVSVTVLPNAPIDAATGLPVPTIAVATQSGISIIKDNGTVVDITTGSGGYTHMTDVDLSSDGWVAWSHSDTRSAKAAPIPDQDKVYGFWTYADDAYNFYESHAFASNLGNVPALVSVGGGITDHIFGKVVVSTDGLTMLGLQKNYDVGVFGDANMPLSAYVTSDYNTGWMMGGIKLATLSDTVAADDNDYVGGYGDFTDANAWTANTGWSLSGNVATKTASTGANYITRASSGTFVYGEWYQAEFDLLSGNGTHVQLVNRHINGVVKPYLGGATNVDVAFFAVGSKCYAIWQQNTNNTNIVSLYASQAVSLDNFKIYKLSAHDRSYENNHLIRHGTITKTAVATGADLMAYGGFNASNYLTRPHNNDFEFGTGNWSMTGWISQTGTASTQHPIQLGLTTGSSSEISILRQTSSAAMLLGFRVRGDSGSYAANPVGGLINPNVWTHFVLTKSGSQLLWYINGKLLHSAASSTVGNIGFSSSDILRIGYGASTVTSDVMKLALLRISATAPSLEQITKMYNDEKHLFATNAKATIYGTSNNTSAIAYDDDTELLHAGTSAGRSVFQGLNRVDNTTDAVSAAISASNGFIVEE
jgi:hypothetical protein